MPKLISCFYNIEEDKIIFLTSIVTTIDLLNFLPPELEIKIDDNFYAYLWDAKGNIQFVIDDVKGFKTVKELKTFIEWHEDIFVDTLSFIGKNTGNFHLSDDYTLYMNLPSTETSEDLMKKFLQFKGLDKKLFNELKANKENYLIVDENSDVKAKFNNIEQYRKYCSENNI